MFMNWLETLAVYRALYPRVALQNAKYFMRFPGDRDVASAIVDHLAAQPGGGVRFNVLFD